MKKISALTLSIIFFSACVKDRKFPEETTEKMFEAPLKINEFVVKGATDTNEFGTAEDWIEIYNNSDSLYNLEPGKWYLTDDVTGAPLKFTLPATNIPARSYLVVWCDDLDTIATQIHTNFKLGAGGEHVGLFYENSAIKIDDYQYPAQNNDNESFARIPDGSSNWGTLSTPTIGASN